MIRIKLRLDPRENQKDAALLYFADRTGMNVRDYIYMAAQERTAQLAQLLSEEIKKTQAQQAQTTDETSQDGDTLDLNSRHPTNTNNSSNAVMEVANDATGSIQTAESQSIQGSGESEQEAVDDTRSESSEG